MATNIFKQELKMLSRSVVTWSVSVTLLLLTFMALFPAFASQADIMNDMLSKFPPQLLAAFGMTRADLSTPLGFFGFIFIFVQICLAIQAANYGFGMVSVEEREWTADFLLSKPVTRTSVLSAKLLAAFTGLTVTNLVVWIVSFAVLSIFNGGRPYETGPLVMLLLSIVLFQLFFLGVGLLISLLVKKIRNVTPYAMGLAFLLYVLNAFGDMLGASVLEKASPFKHFEPGFILKEGTWDWPLAAVSAAVIILAIAGSYLLYNRRDIPAVA